MQPISKYTLETLQHEYNEAELQPKKVELVTDEEVCIFLNEHHWIWPIVFWGMIIFSILYVGVVGK